LLFLNCINDLLSLIRYTVSNKNSPILLFGDDTRLNISEPLLVNFKENKYNASNNEGTV